MAYYGSAEQLMKRQDVSILAAQAVACVSAAAAASILPLAGGSLPAIGVVLLDGLGSNIAVVGWQLRSVNRDYAAKSSA